MMYDNLLWYKKKFKHKEYYARSEHIQGKNPLTILLHRHKMEKRLGRKLKRNEIVDHYDGNTLNNEDENLRILTFQQNIINQKSRGIIKGRGITFEKSSGKFRARICLNYKREHIGRFDTLEEAKEAYKLRAKELYKGVANEDLFN